MLRLGIIVLFVVFALVTVILVTNYLLVRDQLERSTLATAQQQAKDAVKTLNDTFAQTVAVGEGIAADLQSGALPYELGPIRLRSEMNRNPLLDGLAVTFQPYVYDPNERLYQYYVYREEAGEPPQTLLGATYDYTRLPNRYSDEPDTRWYWTPLNYGPSWTDPFFASGAQEILIEYGTRFYRTNPSTNEQEVAGIVTVDYSLRGMQRLVEELDLGSIGYGYVVTQNGTFVSHPDPTLVASKTIYDLTRPYRQTQIAVAVQQALKGTPQTLQSIDPISAEVVWTFLEPIESTGWVLGIVIYKDEYGIPRIQTMREQVLIALSFSVTLYLGYLLAIGITSGLLNRFWLASTGLAALCSANFIFALYASDSFSVAGGVALTSETATRRYIENYQRRVPELDLITVPTGILVEGIAFEGTSIKVQGFIYQQYRNDLPEDFTPGFILPDSITTEFVQELIDVQDTGDTTLHIYQFSNVLYQNFDPSRFPFDRRNVVVRITPADLKYRVILTPDLQSYTTLRPDSMPGISQNVVLINWDIVSTGFNFQEITYNSGFGIEERLRNPSIPELHYTIQTQRIIIGPLIAYALPGIVAVGLLFAFLLYDRTPGDKQELITALNYTAAIFFVIAVIHSGLRESVAAVGITYMEYLYILLYISVVAVSADTFVFVKSNNPESDYSIVPKLIYLPLISGALLSITLGMFILTV
jgi:hypothetical protein